MNIAHVNYAYADDVADPEALLERYQTLTGWSDAIATHSAARVAVVQRFRRDARLVRKDVQYIFCGGAPRSRLWPGRLHRAVAGLAPDVVHVNGLDFPVQTWLLRRELPRRAAIVVQDHASGDPAPSVSRLRRVRRVARRRAMRAADAFFFTAAAQGDVWRMAGFIAPWQRVYQVPEASTTLGPVWRDLAQRTSGMAGNPAVLWVGRLNENKDPLTVLDGFARSLARLPDAALTMIYGAGDLLPAVQARLRDSPLLAARVRLAGRVPHDLMPAFYSAADVFVLGSHHEGSGYALIEACACGLPPAVTDIPSFRVTTAEGSIGALWTPGDASGFADALVNVAQRDRLTSRERVIDHFSRALSWTAVARAATAAYADVIARRDEAA
jgi:glycosyltransferase involved in cell wall biosynthesis